VLQQNDQPETDKNHLLRLQALAGHVRLPPLQVVVVPLQLPARQALTTDHYPSYVLADRHVQCTL